MTTTPPASPPRLTSLSHGGGCGCKIAPGVLASILKDTQALPVPAALLVGIETADQGRGAVTITANAGVMAGGNKLGADLACKVPQLAELEPVVAHHAGVRRASREVLLREVILDPAERVLKVERVKRNVEHVRHPARIGASPGARGWPSSSMSEYHAYPASGR